MGRHCVWTGVLFKRVSDGAVPPNQTSNERQRPMTSHDLNGSLHFCFLTRSNVAGATWAMSVQRRATFKPAGAVWSQCAPSVPPMSGAPRCGHVVVNDEE